MERASQLTASTTHMTPQTTPNAAELLNQKFHDMRRNAPRVEHNKLVIMVALQMAQEVFSLNKSLQEYEHCEHLLQTILEDVEQTVE